MFDERGGGMEPPPPPPEPVAAVEPSIPSEASPVSPTPGGEPSVLPSSTGESGDTLVDPVVSKPADADTPSDADTADSGTDEAALPEDPTPLNLPEFETNVEKGVQSKEVEDVATATLMQLEGQYKEAIKDKTLDQIKDFLAANPHFEAVRSMLILRDSSPADYTQKHGAEGMPITVDGKPIVVKMPDGSEKKVVGLIQTEADTAICWEVGDGSGTSGRVAKEVPRQALADAMLVAEADNLIGGLKPEQQSVMRWHIDGLAGGDVATALEAEDPATLNVIIRRAGEQAHMWSVNDGNHFAEREQDPIKAEQIRKRLEGKNILTPRDIKEIFQISGVEDTSQMLDALTEEITTEERELLLDKSDKHLDKKAKTDMQTRLRRNKAIKEGLEIAIKDGDIGSLDTLCAAIYSGELDPREAEYARDAFKNGTLKKMIERQIGIEEARLSAMDKSDAKYAKHLSNIKKWKGLGLVGGGAGIALVLALIMGMKGGGGQ